VVRRATRENRFPAVQVVVARNRQAPQVQKEISRERNLKVVATEAFQDHPEANRVRPDQVRDQKDLSDQIVQKDFRVPTKRVLVDIVHATRNHPSVSDQINVKGDFHAATKTQAHHGLIRNQTNHSDQEDQKGLAIRKTKVRVVMAQAKENHQGDMDRKNEKADFPDQVTTQNHLVRIKNQISLSEQIEQKDLKDRQKIRRAPSTEKESQINSVHEIRNLVVENSDRTRNFHAMTAAAGDRVRIK
jgi:hypothetical protein